LFDKLFGERLAVGIIAARVHDYDPHRWWTSSVGFRGVVGETIAYVYARFFFHP
jgi:hypothetical protein